VNDMIDITDNGSKESKEAIALAVATQAKYKLGRVADYWLTYW